MYKIISLLSRLSLWSQRILDRWSWFLDVIVTWNTTSLLLSIDKKGLTETVPLVLPNTHHSYCLYHSARTFTGWQSVIWFLHLGFIARKCCLETCLHHTILNQKYWSRAYCCLTSIMYHSYHFVASFFTDINISFPVYDFIDFYSKFIFLTFAT